MYSKKEAEGLFHTEMGVSDPQREVFSAEHGVSCQLKSRFTNTGRAVDGIQSLAISVVCSLKA